MKSKLYQSPQQDLSRIRTPESYVVKKTMGKNQQSEVHQGNLGEGKSQVHGSWPSVTPAFMENSIRMVTIRKMPHQKVWSIYVPATCRICHLPVCPLGSTTWVKSVPTLASCCLSHRSMLVPLSCPRLQIES